VKAVNPPLIARDRAALAAVLPGLARPRVVVMTMGALHEGHLSLVDAAAAQRLVPEGSFAWGGMGGAQNRIDPENRLSYFVAQHTVRSPKQMIEPYMTNILYASI
jgi:CubicO group peptidase (beta-lactamase class C family)